MPDLTMTGCLYGLPAVPPLKDSSYQVWSGTGRNQADEPGAKNSESENHDASCFPIRNLVSLFVGYEKSI